MQLVTLNERAQQGIVLGDNDKGLRVPMEAIVSMYAISNLLMIGPTFDMAILDSGRATLSPMPTDGMPISIAMGDGRSSPEIMDFVCVGSPGVIATPLGPAITINAVLNKPKLFHSVCRTSVNDTSSNAIKKLAEECGLIIEEGEDKPLRVDASAGDKMKWLPLGNKYGQFLADIALHGWFGEESAASVVGVTLDGQVVYRDLAKQAKAEPKHSFYFGITPPDDSDFNHQVYSASDLDRTALGIGQQGYSAEHKRFLLDGELQKYDSVAITQTNEHLNIGMQVRDKVGVGRVQYSAPDCGNTHEFYAQAAYQNMRYRGTYSRVKAVAVNKKIVGLDLGDPVYVHVLDNTDPTKPSVLRTKGIVEARIKCIKNGFYVERYNIAFQGEDSEVIT